MITPTVGRIVHYFDPQTSGTQTPRAGIITGVHAKMATQVYQLIDVTVFPPGSTPLCLVAVPIVLPGEQVRGGGHYCQWMPYQVKKDHGSESGERAAGTVSV